MLEGPGMSFSTGFDRHVALHHAARCRFKGENKYGMTTAKPGGDTALRGQTVPKQKVE